MCLIVVFIRFPRAVGCQFCVVFVYFPIGDSCLIVVFIKFQRAAVFCVVCLIEVSIKFLTVVVNVVWCLNTYFPIGCLIAVFIKFPRAAVVFLSILCHGLFAANNKLSMFCSSN